VFWRKKNKDANGEVKMFFASDLHGSNVCFKKFVNSAKFYGVDVLVLGGDMQGKAVIQITDQQERPFASL
jgi:Icc-related predicted phosphoesterase